MPRQRCSFLFAHWEGGGNTPPVLAVMRRLVARPRRCAENHSIALGDQVVDGVMCIGKSHAELPLKTLEFVAIHRRGTEMTDIVGRK